MKRGAKTGVGQAVALFLAAVLALTCGAAFGIAPMWQRGYSPAAYTAARLPQKESGAALAPGSVDVNTAGKEELKALPGIGDAKAQAILDYRAEHGPFASVQELARVKGISEAMVSGWGDVVCVK